MSESKLKQNELSKISDSKYSIWHLSTSQATNTSGSAWSIRRASHWPGQRLFSPLGSKTLPYVKNYIREVEKRGLVEERGKLWPGLEKWSEGELLCVQAAKPRQAGCGGAVVLLAPALQQQNSGCGAQLFHCGSVVGSCYVGSAGFFLATKH